MMDLRKKQGLGVSVIAMLMVCGPVLAEQPVVSMSVEGGFRVDNISFNAADSATTTADVDWNELAIAQTKLNLDVGWNNIYFNGFLAYGVVVDGESDALSSSTNLSKEAWYGEADGDVQDMGLSLGYRFLVRTVDHRHTYIMPTLGYTFSAQNLDDQVNARATATTAGPHAGPQRAYTTEWDAYSLGLSIWEVDMSRDFTIGLDAAYFKGDLYGVANWDRPDFGEPAYKQPMSFEQVADASGYRMALTGRYGIAVSMDFVFSLEYQFLEADEGTQRNYTTSVNDTPLNKVEWTSTALNVGVSYLF